MQETQRSLAFAELSRKSSESMNTKESQISASAQESCSKGEPVPTICLPFKVISAISEIQLALHYSLTRSETLPFTYFCSRSVIDCENRRKPCKSRQAGVIYFQLAVLKKQVSLWFGKSCKWVQRLGKVLYHGEGGGSGEESDLRFVVLSQQTLSTEPSLQSNFLILRNL